MPQLTQSILKVLHSSDGRVWTTINSTIFAKLIWGNFTKFSI
jgi:hypothetical protein